MLPRRRANMRTLGSFGRIVHSSREASGIPSAGDAPVQVRGNNTVTSVCSSLIRATNRTISHTATIIGTTSTYHGTMASSSEGGRRRSSAHAPRARATAQRISWISVESAPTDESDREGRRIGATNAQRTNTANT